MSFAADGLPGASVERRPGEFWRHAAVMVELEVRKLRHDPGELWMRAAQPVLWLLVFGQAFARIRGLSANGINYSAFLTPGILAQSVTFIAIFYGISILWERDMGLLQKIACTPIRHSALVLGKMLSASVRALSQAVIILILSLLLRTSLHWTLPGVLAVFGLVIIGAALFAGLSMFIAAIVRTRERMMGIGQLITMPLFFSSNALYPISIMPVWLKVVATINPMTYLVDGLRQALLGVGHPLWLDATVTLLVAAPLWAVNTVLYPRILAG